MSRFNYSEGVVIEGLDGIIARYNNDKTTYKERLITEEIEGEIYACPNLLFILRGGSDCHACNKKGEE